MAKGLSVDLVGRLPRYRQLDALRGIAAVVVVFSHLCLFANGDGRTGLFLTPISPFILGQMAVVLFFVLSGFVLSFPYLEGSNQRYPAYLARRICRLYVPFAVVVVASALMLHGLNLYASPPLTGLEATSWNRPVSAGGFLSDVAMAGYPADAARVDPPIWSLIVEMRASLLFPLLVLIVARGRWIGVALGIVVALASAKFKAHIGETSGVSAESALGTLLLTGRYLVFFLFGIMCAARLGSIHALMGRIRYAVHGILILAWIAFTALVAGRGQTSHSYIDLSYGAVALYLIGCCIAYDGLAGILRHRIFQWLGNISFSLYLIHWPILMTAYYALSRDMPQLAIQALSIPAIFVGAHIMERWVERPSHNFGKRLSRRIGYADVAPASPAAQPSGRTGARPGPI